MYAYFTNGFFYIPFYLSHLLELYTGTFIFGFIKTFRSWYATRQNAMQLKRENAEAELKFLQSQLNPHFLFNGLNNIYALALQNSAQTADMILRLSSMMNFILHEVCKERILFSQELQLIEDYIELEKLRYGDCLQFHMTVEGCEEDFMITPLLIFPFVENSFKHGASAVAESPMIGIKIILTNSVLDVTVENSKVREAFNGTDNYREGIGLKNVKRRLELAYPGEYTLALHDDDTRFSIHLLLHIKKTYYENTVSYC